LGLGGVVAARQQPGRKLHRRPDVLRHGRHQRVLGGASRRARQAPASPQRQGRRRRDPAVPAGRGR
jgi:hypothetical protein